jgi:hypothetical protein
MYGSLSDFGGVEIRADCPWVWKYNPAYYQLGRKVRIWRSYGIFGFWWNREDMSGLGWWKPSFTRNMGKNTEHRTHNHLNPSPDE